MKILYYPQHNLSALAWYQTQVFDFIKPNHQLLLLSEELEQRQQAKDLAYLFGFSFREIGGKSQAQQLLQVAQLADCIVSDAPVKIDMAVPQLIFPQEQFKVQHIAVIQSEELTFHLARILPLLTRLFPNLPVVLYNIQENDCQDCVKQTIGYIQANSKQTGYQILSKLDIADQDLFKHSILLSFSPVINQMLMQNHRQNQLIYAGFYNSPISLFAQNDSVLIHQ